MTDSMWLLQNGSEVVGLLLIFMHPVSLEILKIIQVVGYSVQGCIHYGSVSYTHLDVYKRQTLCYLCFCIDL